MKQHAALTLAVLCAATLAGCAMHPRGGGPGGAAEDTRVTVRGDKLVVKPVLAVKAGAAMPTTIGWTLDPAGGYRFTKDGIRIDGRITDRLVRSPQLAVVLDPVQKEVSDCKVADKGGYLYTCVVTPTAEGAFKYTISVEPTRPGLAQVPPLDPLIVIW